MTFVDGVEHDVDSLRLPLGVQDLGLTGAFSGEDRTLFGAFSAEDL